MLISPISHGQRGHKNALVIVELLHYCYGCCCCCCSSHCYSFCFCPIASSGTWQIISWACAKNIAEDVAVRQATEAQRSQPHPHHPHHTRPSLWHFYIAVGSRSQNLWPLSVADKEHLWMLYNLSASANFLPLHGCHKHMHWQCNPIPNATHTHTHNYVVYVFMCVC